MTARRKASPITPFLIALVLSGTLLGCARNQNAPVDAALARETLRVVLDTWKSGEAVDALQDASPAIYVIDSEWQQGVKLKDYQLKAEGDEKDAHLYCPVKLTLQSANGKELKRDVTYIISTAPNLTVARKIF
jgi:hypothetical protein